MRSLQTGHGKLHKFGAEKSNSLSQTGTHFYVFAINFIVQSHVLYTGGDALSMSDTMIKELLFQLELLRKNIFLIVFDTFKPSLYIIKETNKHVLLQFGQVYSWIQNCGFQNLDLSTRITLVLTMYLKNDPTLYTLVLTTKLLSYLNEVDNNFHAMSCSRPIQCSYKECYMSKHSLNFFNYRAYKNASYMRRLYLVDKANYLRLYPTCIDHKAYRKEWFLHPLLKNKTCILFYS